MKICAIICEYNPFHNGHLYQLNEARRRFDDVLCVMSGNFVQRSEPAIMEKNVRARVALNCGASAVLELPLPYAVANGERFANGAVKTLSKFTDVNYIVMGCETTNEKLILTLADIQNEECPKFKSILTERLDQGYTYASALTDATVALASEKGYHPNEITEELSKPNNLLCIEYIKSIQKYIPTCKPILIQRIGSGYHDKKINADFASATALREQIELKNYSAIQACTPQSDYTLSELQAHPVSYDLFSKIALLTMREKSPEEIAQAYDCREGLEYKLKENAYLYNDLNSLIHAVKSKRYTFGRIKRLIINVMLGIDRALTETSEYLPPRLLAIRETFKPFLTQNGSKMIIRADDVKAYNLEAQKKLFACEKRAADIYSILSNTTENLFIPKKLYTI